MLIHRYGAALTAALCLVLSQQVQAREQHQDTAASESATALIKSHDRLVEKYRNADYRGPDQQPISKEAFLHAATVERQAYQIDIKASSEAPTRVRFSLTGGKQPPPPLVTRAITKPGAPKSTEKEVAQWHELIVQRCRTIDYLDTRGKPIGKSAFLQAMTSGIPGLTMTEYGGPSCSRMSLRLLTAAEAASGQQPPANTAHAAR